MAAIESGSRRVSTPPTSRCKMKDFYDLFVLSTSFAFEGETLTLAIDATFKRRTTDISLEHPAFMSKGFFIDLGRTTQWRAYLDRGNLSGAPADFGVIGDALRVFLGPPFEALARKSEFRANWPRGGPWA